MEKCARAPSCSPGKKNNHHDSPTKKKRGRYGSYLSQPHPPVPKTSKWRLDTEARSTEEMDEMRSDVPPPDGDVHVSLEHVESEFNNSPSTSSTRSTTEISNPVHSSDRLTEMEECFEEHEEFEDSFEYLDVETMESGSEDDVIIDNDNIEDNISHVSTPISVNEGDTLIYQGAQITLATSIILTIAFVCRHGISGQAMLDLLTYVELHCLAGSLCTRSMKMLREFFRSSRAPLNRHFYCSNSTCKLYFGSDKDKIPIVCKGCRSKQDKDSPSYFLMSPLDMALKNLFASDGFAEHLQYRSSRSKKSSSNIEDVLDGRWYQEHFSEDGFFRGQPHSSDEIHISFQLNTDGVSVFNSSKYSVWPVFLVINELHPKLRCSRSYRILMGMWFGTEKPCFETFMMPFAKSFNQLYSEGVEVTLPNGCRRTVKAVVLSSVFDAPARCLFQNFNQFNGYSGCPFCLTVGKSVKTSAKGHTLTYPYDLNSDTGHGEPRTHENTIDISKQIHDNMIRTGKKKTLFGVKGYSCFMFVRGFDIIRSVAIDYMHGVMLGVVKMSTKLWFDRSFRGNPFSVYKQLKDVDNRLMNIKPPNCISRPPRPISSHIKFWKASEYRSFILYYAVPCLWGILPQEHFEHLLLLVHALFILLSDSISVIDLRTAEALLKLYCLKIGELYGARYYTSNVHSLLHYCEKVSDLGPLWCNSCFPFEDFNGDISKLFHGTRGIEMQVLSAVAINQQIPLMAVQLNENSQECEFYNKMVSRGRHVKLQDELYEGTHLVGSFTGACHLDDYFAVLYQQFGQVIDIEYFKRVSIRGVVYHSKSYKNVTKRNSFTIMYRVKNKNVFGMVCTYVKLFQPCLHQTYCSAECNCKLAKFVAVVEEMKQDEAVTLTSNKLSDTLTQHLVPIVKYHIKLVVVEIKNFVQKCVWLDVGISQNDFIGVFPNMYEKD